jgi:hypothetical protein
MANTLSHYGTIKITPVKSFTVKTPSHLKSAPYRKFQDGHGLRWVHAYLARTQRPVAIRCHIALEAVLVVEA